MLKHLEESSTSIALDIAEGNGKRSVGEYWESHAGARRFDGHEADRKAPRTDEQHEYEYDRALSERYWR